jgi:hypothetical protein
MASNEQTLHGTATARSTLTSQKLAGQTLATRGKSYSRKPWSAFDAWQEHVRKSAAAVRVAFPERHDRDLRRTIVTG